MEGRTEGRTDPIYRTPPATTGGPIIQSIIKLTNDHLTETAIFLGGKHKTKQTKIFLVLAQLLFATITQRRLC